MTFQQLFEWLKRNSTPSIPNNIPTATFRVSPTLSGHTARTERVIAHLEAVGHIHIRETSFLAWRGLCGEHNAGFISPHRQWCVSCLAADVQSGMRPYDRLLWTPTLMTHCITHNCPLSTTCAFCLARQNVTPISKIHLCIHCGKSLLVQAAGSAVVLGAFNLLVQREIASAITPALHGLTEFASIQPIIHFMAAFQLQILAADKEAYREWVSSRPSCGWHRLQKRVSLPSLIRLSVALKVPVLFILMKPLDAAACAVRPWDSSSNGMRPRFATPLIPFDSEEVVGTDVAARMYTAQKLWIPSPVSTFEGYTTSLH